MKVGGGKSCHSGISLLKLRHSGTCKFMFTNRKFIFSGTEIRLAYNICEPDTSEVRPKVPFAVTIH